MKVIGINGSSHKDGNTAIIINTVFEELNNEGIDTELIQLADIDIQPCRACFACKAVWLKLTGLYWVLQFIQPMYHRR